MPHTARPILHIVGRFDDPHTGAERSLPDLAELLRGRRDTRLWSDTAVAPYFEAHGVQAMRPEPGCHPVGGSLLISGVHVQLGGWLERCGADKVTLRYNLPNHQRLFDAIARIRAATGHDPELVFVSQALQDSVGLPGRVEPSLIQLDALLDLPVAPPRSGPLVVGRLSRDVVEKHDPQDVAVYKGLAARGFAVRVMGGTCLSRWLEGVPGVELLPAGHEPLADFLASLDVFFYRTGSFIEPYGRVVLEAMGAGLPVVVAANGGFAEQITQGADGLLVRNQEEALHALQRLLMAADLRRRIGAQARTKALSVHGPAAIERLVSNYLL